MRAFFVILSFATLIAELVLLVVAISAYRIRRIRSAALLMCACVCFVIAGTSGVAFRLLERYFLVHHDTWARLQIGQWPQVAALTFQLLFVVLMIAALVCLIREHRSRSNPSALDLMHERKKFDARPLPSGHMKASAFLPRSRSKIVFVLVVTCYIYALTALFAVIVRLFHFPPRPLQFWETHGDPTAHIIEGLVFAPLIETCILVAIIELLRWLRVPTLALVFLAGALVAWPHSYAWHWGPYAFVVLPSFIIQAAAYLYWREVSRKRGFAVVASIHALVNLLPALYTIAYATREV
jgi:hypothetical protein